MAKCKVNPSDESHLYQIIAKVGRSDRRPYEVWMTLEEANEIRRRLTVGVEKGRVADFEMYDLFASVDSYNDFETLLATKGV